MKFEQMNLIRPILRSIRGVGYTEPTPIQQKTIPPVLQGKDVLGCAQTGTGKTAAFALPILQRVAKAEDFDPTVATRPIRALILTPTRELALQIHENFQTYGQYLPVKCAVIFGGVNQNPQVEQLRAGVDILVATPGRLNDLIGQGHISLRDIRIFVLDEADRMLDMGFIHDVRKVMAKLPEQRQTLLFSATMPPQVEEIAAQLLTKPVNVKISPVTSTVDSVAQSVYYLEKTDKINLLLYLLNGNGVASALVFTRTKHGADQVARKLNKNNVKALAIHGDKSQNSRQTALNRFKAGEIDVLVATDIAARGIDIVELPTVINYNVPEEPETYIHRIGRTGRAGQEGVAITFCCSDELESFRDILKLIHREVEEKKCEWSVEDMQPTKPERKQQNGRDGQQKFTEKSSEQPRSQAEAQQKQKSQLKPQAETQPKQKSQPKPQTEVQQKQKKQADPQPKREMIAKEQPVKQKKPKQTPMQAEKPAPTEAQKQEKAEHRSDLRRAKREKSPIAIKVQPPKNESAKPSPVHVDRRYTDSGEHDGATGQQIVTNFNRSVWLEFNEPPKKPKKMWQTPITPAKNEVKNVPVVKEAEPAETAEVASKKGVISKLRASRRNKSRRR
jgi:ATP-dependent RNA helicase RhlE